MPPTRLNKVQLRLHGDLFEFDEELDMLIAADVLYDKENLPLLNTFAGKPKKCWWPTRALKL